MSILCYNRIFCVSERLKQIKCNTLFFGRLCVGLVEYSVQLPPVLVENLWVEGLPSRKIDDRNAYDMYMQLSDVVVLKENNWLDETDSESGEFHNILELAREGKVTKNAREILICKCSMFRMKLPKFQGRVFDDDGLCRILCNNKDMENYHYFQILKLQKIRTAI